MQKRVYDISNKKVQYLMTTDVRLSDLIQTIGSCELHLEKDGFKCLVKYIIGQQISDKARETIWIRMNSIDGGVTAHNICGIDIKVIQSIGISERKARYIKNLAQNIVNMNTNLLDISYMTNEEIIEQLTSIKGIGKWTAEMYLIFSLGRENVISSGDGTIKRVVKWLYELQELPSSDDIINIFEKWCGYETIVSAYFWAAITTEVIKQPFSQLRL